MVEIVKHLLSKNEAISSTPVLPQKKKKEWKEEREEGREGRRCKIQCLEVVVENKVELYPLDHPVY
jgi:hypothetical protein